MITEGMTVKCGICGELFVFYNNYVGDQSVCPSCRRKARDNMVVPSWMVSKK